MSTTARAILAFAVIAAVAFFFAFSSSPAAPADATSRPAGSTSTPVVVKPAPAPKPTPAPKPSGITVAQVSAHGTAASCWTAIGGQVYDLTAWINEHPGGDSAILSICGKDGTAAFDGQHGGQGRPEAILGNFKIGALAS